MAKVLDSTHGVVLYSDQLVELVKLLGFEHAWAERFRRAIAGGRAAGRDVIERAIREAGARQRWTTVQSNQLLALLIKRVGYSLLTDAERRLLEWLSIFAGGWTLEAAEAVCAGDGIDAEHVLELLARLVDKSLVVSAGPAVGPVWCRLLEPLRQDARERLVARGEMEVLNGRQAAYFLARAESVQPDLLGPTAMLGLDQLDRDHANLRLALSWLVDQPDVERAQRLAGTLGRFWLVRAHFTEGEGWFRQALALPGSERRSAARAACVYGLGSLRLAQGDYVTAEAQLDEALVLFREAGNRVGEAWTLMGLGQAARLRGKHGAARARLEEGVAASRVAAQSAPESMCQQVLADVACAEGDLLKGRAHAKPPSAPRPGRDGSLRWPTHTASWARSNSRRPTRGRLAFISRQVSSPHVRLVATGSAHKHHPSATACCRVVGGPLRSCRGCPGSTTRGRTVGRPGSRLRLAADACQRGADSGRGAGERGRLEPQMPLVPVRIPNGSHSQARCPVDPFRPRGSPSCGGS